VTVGYSSGGLVMEEIITFMVMWDLPNYSRKISHNTQRQTGFYHIVFFYKYFSADGGTDKLTLSKILVQIISTLLPT